MRLSSGAGTTHVLKTRLIKNATDDSNKIWNDNPYMFHDKKSYFEYKMKKLKDIGTSITCIKARHNCVQASKRYSS